MNNIDINNILVLASFFVPGYITLQIYNAIKPTKEENSLYFLINFIVFSFINVYLYKLVSNIEAVKNLNSDLVVLIISIIMGVVIGISNPLHLLYIFFSIGDKSSLPTAWDYVFYNIDNGYLILTLSNDTKLKCLWENESFASNADKARDVYFEKVYYKNENDEWVENKESKEIYISKDYIKTIEFACDINNKKKLN